jgi:4-amino-4-deoxy-L-arabinose transferase-like glycosyltransferase
MAKLGLQFNSPLIHAVVLILLSLPYFINLGVSSIWDANEAFYAETPREMLASGDYLSPQFNFQPRVQKPPLTYWTVLASYKIFGVNEFAVRFPGALAALGVLLFSYGMARMLFSPQAALFSAAITATTARIFILERRLPIDILLLFF